MYSPGTQGLHVLVIAGLYSPASHFRSHVSPSVHLSKFPVNTPGVFTFAGQATRIWLPFAWAVNCPQLALTDNLQPFWSILPSDHHGLSVYLPRKLLHVNAVRTHVSPLFHVSEFPDNTPGVFIFAGQLEDTILLPLAWAVNDPQLAQKDKAQPFWTILPSDHHGLSVYLPLKSLHDCAAAKDDHVSASRPHVVMLLRPPPTGAIVTISASLRPMQIKSQSMSRRSLL
eukprot:SAG25_NODE_112_length_14924_cov_13.606476_12_plen_228_part_00